MASPPGRRGRSQGRGRPRSAARRGRRSRCTGPTTGRLAGGRRSRRRRRARSRRARRRDAAVVALDPGLALGADRVQDAQADARLVEPAVGLLDPLGRQAARPDVQPPGLGQRRLGGRRRRPSKPSGSGRRARTASTIGTKTPLTTSPVRSARPVPSRVLIAPRCGHSDRARRERVTPGSVGRV